MHTLNYLFTIQVLLSVLSAGSLCPAYHVVCVECWIIMPSRLCGVRIECWIIMPSRSCGVRRVLDHYAQQIVWCA